MIIHITGSSSGIIMYIKCELLLVIWFITVSKYVQNMSGHGGHNFFFILNLFLEHLNFFLQVLNFFILLFQHIFQIKIDVALVGHFLKVKSKKVTFIFVKIFNFYSKIKFLNLVFKVDTILNNCPFF